MKKYIATLFIQIFSASAFAQPVAFAPLPNSPMGKVLSFAYNPVVKSIWACTQGKVFYQELQAPKNLIDEVLVITLSTKDDIVTNYLLKEFKY